MLVGIGPEISESIKNIYTAARVCAPERTFLSSDKKFLGANPMGGG